MKNLILVSLFIFFLISCGVMNSSKKVITDNSNLDLEHSSMSALDWNGTYRGTIPCADCPGIKTELTLHTDQTYVLKELYLESSSKIFESKGHFSWNAEGSKIYFGEGEFKRFFFVGENYLEMLTPNGDEIKSGFSDKYMIMKQTDDHSFLDKTWVINEIDGKNIQGTTRKVPQLTFSSDQKLSGNDGCNQLMGSFEFDQNQNIAFSQIGSTKMACPDMTIPQLILDALNNTSSFETDGTDLILKSENGKNLMTLNYNFFEE